jgi:hypothetical protein
MDQRDLMQSQSLYGDGDTTMSRSVVSVGGVNRSITVRREALSVPGGQ